MKKALNAFAVALTLFAVIGLATPVFACGGGKNKSETTASTEKDDSEKSTEKAKSDESDSKKDKSESPTKS